MEPNQNQDIPPPLTGKPGSVYSFGRLVLILAIIAVSFVAGQQAGKKGYVFVPKTFSVINRENQPQTVDYQLLWDAIGILDKQYIDKPIDQHKILYGAIAGAVAGLGDPYTAFFTPKELENFETDLKGSFGGIGAEIGKRDGYIVVIAPIDDTPAQQAGLRAKDIIAQVDGKSTQDWTVEQAVEAIRGKVGTKVTLTVVREGAEKPFELTLTRSVIKIKSVKWETKEVEKDGVRKKIEVISLTRFGEDTNDLFSQAISDALQHSVDGIILDLRNDPGGFLETSVNVASAWIPQGDLVVTEAHSNGSSERFTALGNNRLAGIKTVVLINGGSASASEILAGALQDHKIALLIGEKSFGKGSVQELQKLSDGSGLKITIAKWVTPGGVNLNKDGLKPDIEVKMTEDDYNNKKDPQMEKALEQVLK